MLANFPKMVICVITFFPKFDNFTTQISQIYCVAYSQNRGKKACVNVIYILSRYGELVNINLVRDQKSGKSKGFCFICYEDQRSTILAVDNFNGIKVCYNFIRSVCSLTFTTFQFILNLFQFDCVENFLFIETLSNPSQNQPVLSNECSRKQQLVPDQV